MSKTKIQSHLVFILGNQLFPLEKLKEKMARTSDVIIFMREDEELCTHFRYHKHKILFFLAAMRQYAQELRTSGYTVHYESLGEFQGNYEDRLKLAIQTYQAQRVSYFEIEDRFFETRIEGLLRALPVSIEIWQSPMFFLSRNEFAEELKAMKRPFMKVFYERQRKRFKILVDRELKPIGGQWSFDEANRKALPKDVKCPALAQFKMSPVQLEVANLVEEKFGEHPGATANFWIPTDRAGAIQWLEDFLSQRFSRFGDYEDALTPDYAFVFHSVLTPFLNAGLLTPQEVVERSLASAKVHGVSLNSCEGFIRQVLGWREFIRGIDRNFGEIQAQKNFWNHGRRLTDHWYRGNTDIAPLDDVIRKTVRYGYAHHIERLMVVGSLMLLLEVHPHEAYRWFMEMFIDSSDWVMGPNVYGMALFSDGGIFATKPYICGSNYYKKMGGYRAGEWTAGVDGLYWSFIDRHREFLSRNPRLSMMVKLLDKMQTEKKKRVFDAAQDLRERITRC
jgi:deoxyribodipyrimidine photolyase-related protein